MSTLTLKERMLLYPEKGEPRYFVREGYGNGWLNGYAAAYRFGIWDRVKCQAIAISSSRDDAYLIAHTLNAAMGLPDTLPDKPISSPADPPREGRASERGDGDDDVTTATD